MTAVLSQILVLVLASLIHKIKAGIAHERCPVDLPSTSSINLFGNKCYQFVADERYWDEARDYCFEHNGRLVKIDSAETNDFIVETLNKLWWQNNGVWIGLHDRNVEMSWQWVGLIPYSSEPVSWTNWGHGHPRAVLHTVRDCVRMVRGNMNDWLWHETPCHLLNWKYRFICEYEASPTTVRPRPTILSAAPALTTTTKPNRIIIIPQISHHAGVDRRMGHSNDVQSYSRSLSKDDLPSHEAVIGSEQQQPSSVNNDHKWLVVLLVVAVAAMIIVVVGVVLFRRKRDHKAHLSAVESSSEFSDDFKQCSDTVKSSDSIDLPENNTLARQHSQVRATSNIYVPTGLSFSRPTSGVYEDIGPQGVKDDKKDEETSRDQAYVPMNGSNKGALLPFAGYTVASSRQSCGYLDMNDRKWPSTPDYKNCPIADGKMLGYDASRLMNIYSEIPENDDDIYESLESVKA